MTDLPQTPTWGVAMVPYPIVGRWSIDGNFFVEDAFGHITKPDYVVDFILFTDEQVKRIEAAR